MYTKKCCECGGEFKARQYNADFCGTPCRRTFNNRRAVRGAALYDLLMIKRDDPEAFEAHRLDGRVERMLEEFVKEDKGKRTWKRAREVMYDTSRFS